VNVKTKLATKINLHRTEQNRRFITI